jgi:hypothetical protein
MRRTDRSAKIMQPYTEHPTDETLEQFLMHRMQESEIESLETHILACESCVTRLEDLEINLEATKMALTQLHNQTVAKNHAAAAGNSRWAWLKLPSFSLAAAGAALALALVVVPAFSTVEMTVDGVRGTESPTLPAGRPVLLHLNAKDLAQQPVSVEIVNGDGSEVWKGMSSVDHNKVDAKLPKLKDSGSYLLRLYAQNKKNSEQGDLLREFSFQVR